MPFGIPFLLPFLTLQLHLHRRKLPDPQEFLDETKWIYEKLRLRDKKYNDVAYQKKIF